MIRTGRVSYATTAPVRAVRPIGRNEPWPVFGPGPDMRHSRVIAVKANERVRVTAYNLCAGCIVVNRVVLGKVEPFSLKCCEQRGGMQKPPDTVPPVLFNKPAASPCGDALHLSPDNTEVELEGPGTYQLSFDDCPNAGVYVEAQRISECCERR